MAGFHEIIQSAPQVVHQAKELIDAGMRSELLQKLIESGHPYGLLLSQSNDSSSVKFSHGFFESKFPQRKVETKAAYKQDGSKGLVGVSMALLSPSKSIVASSLAGGVSDDAMVPFWSITLLNSSLANSFFPSLLSFVPEVRHEEIDEFHNSFEKSSGMSGYSFQRSSDVDNIMTDFSKGSGLTVASKAFVLSSAKSNVDLARKSNLEQLFTQQVFLVPVLSKRAVGEKEITERVRELVVGKNGVGLGTAAVKFATFQGQEPFTIKLPGGEELAQIYPGEPIGHIHLSHQASQLRQLSPLEKVSIMTNDLIDLFSAIDQPIMGEVPLQQQEVLAKAKQAIFIGISHLVRLFGRKTSLPTWKLDILPELMQRFHQHDSQAVSKAFGGTRKVKPGDVEMMVITPTMRQQLISNYA
ncbi:MAG: hypothetical protein V1810_00920 [Candidatus Beckwithbacteria bacterium]